MGAWSQHVAGAAIEGPADQDDLMWDSLKSEASSGAEVGAGWESASLIAVEHLVSAEHRGRLTVFQDRGVSFHQSKPSYRGPPIFVRQSRVFFTSSAVSTSGLWSRSVWVKVFQRFSSGSVTPVMLTRLARVWSSVMLWAVW